MRQPRPAVPEPLLRSYAVTHGPGALRFPQDPRWHQLIHADAGVVRLDTHLGSWTLPHARALWVRAGIEHGATVVRRATMRTLYLHAGQLADAGIEMVDDEVAVVEVSPVVSSLVGHLVDVAPLAGDDLGVAWATVLLDRLRSLEVAPVRLPAVRASPAREVADLLRADPGRDDDIDALARLVGSSRRTVERAFAAETGMSVGAWRRQLRLLRAVELLAAGEPVGRVASAVGYATQSAFGAMFRAHFDVAPGRYFDSQDVRHAAESDAAS